MQKKVSAKHLLFILIPTLISCTSDNSGRLIFPEKKNTHGLNVLMTQYTNNVEQIWGNSEVLIPAPQDYIRYSSDFKTRSHTDFSKGTIVVETISPENIINNLHLGIVTTLLMGDEVDSDLIYSTTDLKISASPLLLNQIKDNEDVAIQTEWRASRFADYILTNQLKKRRSGNQTIYYVIIHLIPNHIDERAHRFMPYVTESARKYSVDPALILAIAQIESSFNPHAVSRSNALGLMQIQPHTAGRDIFRSWGKDGEPSRTYLLNPRNNIEMGAAYIKMLRDVYLAGIENKQSQYYALVMAYNGGAGSVLRVFSDDKQKAVKKINTMSPEKVYQTLVTQHPSQESRNYLQKVHQAHGKYVVKKK